MIQNKRRSSLEQKKTVKHCETLLSPLNRVVYLYMIPPRRDFFIPPGGAWPPIVETRRKIANVVGNCWKIVKFVGNCQSCRRGGGGWAMKI